MVALAGLWLSVVTDSALGLVGILAVLFVAFDLRSPLPGGKGATLTASRRSEGKALMRTPVVMELTVENQGASIERLFLRETLPAHTKVTRGSTSLFCGLESGERVTLRYEVSYDEPGVYDFKSCTARIESMFGLAERTVDLTSPFSVRVYPRHLSRPVNERPAVAFGWSGITPSRFRGGRLDFMDIRQYNFGDPFKDVNWKASGRLGRALINERNVERGLDCIVVVDLSSEGLPRVREWSGRPDVIAAAYELTSSLTGTGNRVGMLVLGNTLRKTRPGFGARHMKFMVEGLVDSREGMVWSMDYTETLLEMFFRKQYRTRGGTLFFVFARPSAKFIETLESLTKKGFVCNSVLVDVLGAEEAALIDNGILKESEAAFGRRFARAEMEHSVGVLRQVSNTYIWRAGEGFREADKVRMT